MYRCYSATGSLGVGFGPVAWWLWGAGIPRGAGREEKSAAVAMLGASVHFFCSPKVLQRHVISNIIHVGKTMPFLPIFLGMVYAPATKTW